MKRKLITSFIIILTTAVVAGYFLWFRSNDVSQKSVKQTNISSVSDSDEKFVSASGVVEPISEEIEVGVEIPGKIKKVFVEEGEQVARGQIIAVLENGEIEAAINTAKTEIETLEQQQETARARLYQAQMEKKRIENGARPEERREAKASYEQTIPVVENAQKEFERRQKLYGAEVISREELERSERDLKVAKAKSRELSERFKVVNAEARKDDLDKADAAILAAEMQVGEFASKMKAARAKVEEAKTLLEKTVVRSPISGIILRKRLKGGESVSPENTSGIVTLADTSALRVRVDLDETDVAKIKENQTAYVMADAYDSKKFPAKVIQIGQILGRKNFDTERPNEKVDTKILEVLLELEPNNKLPLGLRVTAFINTNDR